MLSLSCQDQEANCILRSSYWSWDGETIGNALLIWVSPSLTIFLSSSLNNSVKCCSIHTWGAEAEGLRYILSLRPAWTTRGPISNPVLPLPPNLTVSAEALPGLFFFFPPQILPVVSRPRHQTLPSSIWAFLPFLVQGDTSSSDQLGHMQV